MWPFTAINKKLDLILALLGSLQRKEIFVMATIAELITQVKANTDVEASAVLAINGLLAKIQDLINAGADPVALQAAVDELKASATQLGAAVALNT
jgi:hypothetical protein